MTLMTESRSAAKIMLVRLSPLQEKKMMHPLGVMPPFSLKYIQALLEKESCCDVRLFDCLIRPLSLNKLAAKAALFSFDCLVLYVDVLTYPLAVDFASRARQYTVKPVILFGPGIGGAGILDPSFLRIAGEAEEKVAGIIKDCILHKDFSDSRARSHIPEREAGEITVEDIDALPFPKYSRMELERYAGIFPLRSVRKARYGFVLSSRGCPHTCGFCSGAIRISSGSRVRVRAPGRVVDEIESLADAGANVISFADDDFTCSRSHVNGVCEEILRRKLTLRWIAHARFDEVSLPLLKLMKRSGCILLRFGVESACERVLRIFNKCADPQNWGLKARAVSGWLDSLGVACDAMFIIGSPGETEKEIIETRRLCMRMNPDFIQVHYYTPYQDSRLAADHNPEFSDRPGLQHHYIIPRRNLSSLGNYRLRQLRASFYLCLFLNPLFLLRHLKRYGLFYIYNPRVFFSLLRMFACF
ncbi:MAG: radical SAM protein [Candidatus Omnitrophota bacterium]|jgi:hypothetical protein